MFKCNKDSKPNGESNLVNRDADAKSLSVLLLIVGLLIICIIDSSYRSVYVSIATSAISVNLALNIQNVNRK